jgi:hypothetical protein
MTFDLERVIASKRAYRQRLAMRPIGEKLRLLDAARPRTRHSWTLGSAGYRFQHRA